MKKIFTLVFALTAILLSTALFAQSDVKNQIIVYFKTGVQRNALKSAAATITSSKIAALLNTYGVTAADIKASFPDFNEADTLNT